MDISNNFLEMQALQELKSRYLEEFEQIKEDLGLNFPSLTVKEKVKLSLARIGLDTSYNGSLVYLLEGDGGHFKVGYTRDILTRIRTYQ